MKSLSLHRLFGRFITRTSGPVRPIARRRSTKSTDVRPAEVLEERRVLSNSPVSPVADFGVARAEGPENPQLLNWYLNTDGDALSEINFEYGFGNGTGFNQGKPDTALAGDLLGLGFDQQIVVRAHPNGKLWWFVNTDTDPADEFNFFFGRHGDTPIIGDFNGDGRDDPAFVSAVSIDPVSGARYSDPLLFWSIHSGSLPASSGLELNRDAFDRWGFIGDRPVVGDWDGDGRDTPGLVSRQATPQGLNRWYINQNGVVTFDYGFPTDKPIVGDWDGDGRDNVGVIREGAGANGLSQWLLDTDRDPSQEITFDYGFRGDQYVVGKWRTPETAGINVTPTSGLQTTEAGGTASFSVVLTSAPASNVVIPISTSDASEGTASVSQLVFTPSNWNQPQTVTVRGADDNLDDGDVAYSIVTGAASSNDSRYNGLNAADVHATNRDNDDPLPTAGINVTPTSGLQTTEAGGTASFSVVLTSAPTSNVVIPISTSDASEGTASVSQLTFTPNNWNRPQTVTVRGVDDNLDDGDVGYSIVTGAANSSDSRYNGLNAADVQVSNRDNDDPPVQALRFVVQYTDGQGEGFYDSTLGAARRQALEYALSLWSNILVASYQGEVITIAVSMDSLGGSAGGATLASAGPTTIHRDFSNATASTWYGAALANHVAQSDLVPELPEIAATFNADVDNQTVLGSRDWYYGLDGNAGSEIDFVTVAMHEVGHGLNFLSLVNPDGGYFTQNLPGVWDRQLEIRNGTDLTNLNAAQRQAALVGSDLFWQGAQGVAGNGGQRPEIHAPNPFQGGSSTSHLDEATHPNELLSPIYSGVDHQPSRLEQGMLVDMGWDARGLPRSQGNTSAVVLFNTGFSMANQTFGTIEIQTPSLSVSDVTIREDGSRNVTATFTVQLSQPSKERVQVKYATVDGDAQAGRDYDRKTGTLTFARGETTKTVSVTVRKDKVQELDEFFLVQLTQPTNAVLEQATGRCTIQDSSTKTAVAVAPSVLAVSAPRAAEVTSTRLNNTTTDSIPTNPIVTQDSNATSGVSRSQESPVTGVGLSADSTSSATKNGVSPSSLALQQIWSAFDQLAGSL